MDNKEKLFIVRKSSYLFALFFAELITSAAAFIMQLTGVTSCSDEFASMIIFIMSFICLRYNGDEKYIRFDKISKLFLISAVFAALSIIFNIMPPDNEILSTLGILVFRLISLLPVFLYSFISYMAYMLVYAEFEKISDNFDSKISRDFHSLYKLSIVILVIACVYIITDIIIEIGTYNVSIYDTAESGVAIITIITYGALTFLSLTTYCYSLVNYCRLTEVIDTEELSGHVRKSILTKVLVFACVSFALIMEIEVAIRVPLCKSPLKKAEEYYLNTEINKSEIDNIFMVQGLKGDSSFTPVTTMAEVKAALDKDFHERGIVVKTAKENIHPLGEATFKMRSYSGFWTRYDVLYGKGYLMRNSYSMKDCVVYLPDGSMVYATYPTFVLDNLADGEVILPIAMPYVFQDSDNSILGESYYYYVNANAYCNEGDILLAGDYAIRSLMNDCISKNAETYSWLVKFLTVLSFVAVCFTAKKVFED